MKKKRAKNYAFCSGMASTGNGKNRRKISAAPFAIENMYTNDT